MRAAGCTCLAAGKACLAAGNACLAAGCGVVGLTAQELYEAANRQKTIGLGAAAMARLRRDYSEPPAPRRTPSWYEWLTGSAPPDAEYHPA